ncbi:MULTISPECIES: DNA-J related domain-containing protein [Thalassolituus]|uniref:DNA-J related domain-containing protein n=1 Tax=Thalassolituus TaxID=187492 RepID=UPI000C485E4E|nr:MULTISPECIES: DNA-J related domain-containing protein [Thalassolituus]MAG43912.1 molecular chaperone DnaJ [Oceanospirillaceae bacterium]MAX87215.1 molecular chaperone DnaJ [Oceanospirillaceae bacterium]MEE3159624.1 DNA-J related domain-containing protein [Pseudomonadota bacterium]|tara:strand:- start:326 stop:907 length:582 start_codon:yes stop_codon:yes gene_type:complete
MEEDTLNLVTDLLATYLADGHRCPEYELIRWLQAPEQGIFREDALSDSMTLFRANFIVMHALYRLRNRWLEDARGYLQISALDIGLVPLKTDSGSDLPDQHDALAEYYLDLNNLDTDQASVDALLNDFWQRMVIPEHYDDDLAMLELTPPVDLSTIRQQYRRLASQHHPDKGGDAEAFRKVSSAYQRLRYRHG